MIVYFGPDMQIAYGKEKQKEVTLVLQQCTECSRQVYELVDGKRCLVCEGKRHRGSVAVV